MTRLISLAERFWPKVDRRGPGDCWLWTGALAGNGYGHIRRAGRDSTVQAHRVAYELLIGPIPAGLELDHLCRVKVCVNPAHLEPVTHAENVRRAWPMCRAGLHEWTPENTGTTQHGRRQCRKCRHAFDLRLSAERKIARIRARAERTAA